MLATLVLAAIWNVLITALVLVALAFVTLLKVIKETNAMFQAVLVRRQLFDLSMVLSRMQRLGNRLIAVVMAFVTGQLFNVHVTLVGVELVVRFPTVQKTAIFVEPAAIMALGHPIARIVPIIGWDLRVTTLVFMGTKLPWIVEFVHVILASMVMIAQ